MTRKHFIALARALKFAREEMDRGMSAQICIAGLVDDIAIVCQQSNEHFDKARFRAACQPKQVGP